MDVLIVDDEQIIRQGIKTFVPWDELGCRLCGEAASGEEALDLMKQSPARIVITDIRMPGMNGLELSRRLREEYPRCKVILLTGYEDFAYAKTAIKYRVTEYLLKPAGDRELTDTLRATIRLIEEEDRIRLKQGHMEELVEKNETDLKIKDLQKLLRGDGRNLNYDWDENGIYQAMLALTESEEMLPPLPQGSFSFPHPLDDVKGRLVFLSYGAGEEQFFEEMRKAGITAVIGSKNRGITGIAQSYREADSACQYVCFLLGPTLVHYDAGHLYREKFLRTLPPPIEISKVEYDMEHMFSSLNPCLGNIIGSMLHYCIIENRSRKEFIRHIRRLFDLAVKELAQKGILFDERDTDPFDNISPTESWQEIWEKSDQAFLELTEFVSEVKQTRYSPLTNRAIGYIRKHFKEEVPLKQVALFLGVTESHISRVFKKETGINFVPWINRFRVEYSLDLLAESHLKLYDIADLSGFSDYKYYTKQFKKYMNQTPSEYRKHIIYSRR